MQSAENVSARRIASSRYLLTLNTALVALYGIQATTLLSFAALWERWSKDGESLESFAVITMAASPALADIHHRQPAIIDSDRFDDWLDPKSSVP